MTTNGGKMYINLTRERAQAQICENLISVGILLRDEAARYGKVLDTYDNLTLARVLVVSHEMREAGGEIVITG